MESVWEFEVELARGLAWKREYVRRLLNRTLKQPSQQHC
jgi:hypothetical protein